MSFGGVIGVVILAVSSGECVRIKGVFKDPVSEGQPLAGVSKELLLICFRNEVNLSSSGQGSQPFTDLY